MHGPSSTILAALAATALAAACSTAPGSGEGSCTAPGDGCEPSATTSGSTTASTAFGSGGTSDSGGNFDPDESGGTTRASTGSSSEGSTGGNDDRPEPLIDAVPYLERFLSHVDASTLGSFEPNPFLNTSDTAAYYLVARANVLLADAEVALLSEGERAALVAQASEFGDLLVNVEASNNTCAQTFRTDHAELYPPGPIHGWGFVGNYAEGDQVAAYADSYPGCSVAGPLIVGTVSGDANPPLIRFGYNDGHAAHALLFAARAFDRLGIEARRSATYVDLAKTVLDDWAANHCGTPEGYPGCYYEEFHDGVDYGGHPHQRLYWAANSNATLGRAFLELAAAVDPAESDDYVALASAMASTWKNELTLLDVGGAYAWLYARSSRPQDEYVEDTVHAGVTIPFIADAFAERRLSIYGSDVQAVAKALDLVVPPPHTTVRRWMDGVDHGGLDLPVESHVQVGEWAALAVALRVDDYTQARDYLAVLDTVTGQQGDDYNYGYYRLLLDSYAIRALAQ